MSNEFETVHVKLDTKSGYFECNPGNVRISFKLLNTYVVNGSLNDIRTWKFELYWKHGFRNYFLYSEYENNIRIASTKNFNKILTKDIVRDMKIDMLV